MTGRLARASFRLASKRYRMNSNAIPDPSKGAPARMRPGPHSMGSAPEASSGRIRYHLRRPIPSRGELLTKNAQNTVKGVVPK